MLLLALWPCVAPASESTQGATAPPNAAAHSRERLSDWLLRSAPLDATTRSGYGAGLMLTTPEEKTGQQALKSSVLRLLAEDSSARAWGIQTWLSAMPVTGRVAIGSADARWLQANPDQDPILKDGDAVRLPARPTVVAVVGSKGEVCRVRHQPGADAAAYVSACGPAAAGRWGLNTRPARAWLAQPDGRTFHVGVAAWSLDAQPEPAPGAWLVPEGPSGPSRWEPPLARFLATQGPAPDEGLVSSTDASWGAPRPPVRPPRGLDVTASDWGEIGLLQTPTARLGEAGTFRFHWSHVWPYSRGTVIMQPFDWLEGGIRYTDIDNRLYGPSIAGDQSYKDKSIDFKIRLLEEGPWWPQVGLGVRDLGGTGQFSGEYLVGNKRLGDFDVSLGLGWGYLGARGTFRNPLSSVLGSAFDQRTNDVGQGGTVATGSLFRGRTALFGGVQWHTPWRQVWLKAEIEGNDYRSEPMQNPQPQSSPLNVGVVWRPRPGIDLALGWERGREVMFSLTLDSTLARLAVPKTLDPPLPKRASVVTEMPAGPQLAQAIEAQTGWQVARIELDSKTAHVHFSDAPGVYRRQAVDRVAQVLDAMLPERVEHFVLHFGQRSLVELNLYTVDRQALVSRATRASSPAASREVVKAAAVGSMPGLGEPLWQAPRARPRLSLSPNFGYILGGPDGFLLYQLGAALQAQWPFGDGTWLAGTAAARVIDNYDRFKWPGYSLLPQVRTFQKEYVTTRRLTLPKLQLSHVGQISPSQSYLLYGGLLEPMFAGIGGEWMWRPSGSPFYVGLDVNRVRQRGFEQNFSLRDYAVTTGHLTGYWNTGWQGLGITASVGQYLAGDRGVTLEVTRTFDNGVVMGAYATKSNVPAAVFGEGSFDKGIFVSVPTDAILPRTTNRYLNVMWSPLTRDGGAKLSRSESLQRLTRLADSAAFRFVEALPPPRMKTGEPLFEP